MFLIGITTQDRWRLDAKAETPILWPPHAKGWLIGKDSYAGRDWGQEEKGTTEDEMAGWHHRLDGLEFEWSPGVVMDREVWYAAIHGVAKSWTWLSDWTDWLTDRYTVPAQVQVHWWLWKRKVNILEWMGSSGGCVSQVRPRQSRIGRRNGIASETSRKPGKKWVLEV